jgi:hemoglobin
MALATQAETASAPATPNTPFHKLGGHATMQAICNRFYDLMDSDPAYAELRAMHAADLAPMRKSLPLFLAGWAGGPRDWFEQNPGRCMMSVAQALRDQSRRRRAVGRGDARAIADVAPEPADLAEAMGKVLGELAMGMGKD